MSEKKPAVVADAPAAEKATRKAAKADKAAKPTTTKTGWLREHVHQYGQLMEPADIVKNACGEFDPHYYLDYLNRKYTELYDL